MSRLSYGLSAAPDIFEKFKREGSKLGPSPHSDDVFNFFVTGSTLNEWVYQLHGTNEIVREIRDALGRDGSWEKLPDVTGTWIVDTECLPNRHIDPRVHIFNALRLCWETAGASKHFRWEGSVTMIDTRPIVANWYDYFHTSTAPDLYIKYGDYVYGLSQVSEILTQFYLGLFASFEPTKGNANA